jgi:putative endonuclease
MQSMSLPVTARELGDYGERLAQRYLREQGMAVLDRHWRHGRLGELDLVARDGACLVAVEVKTRRAHGYGTPVEGVTARKLARLRRLAAAWVHEHDESGCLDLRIDVVGVLRPPTGPCVIEHLRGVA